MKPTQFSSQVSHIPLSEIRPSHHNPRGVIDRDDSFNRLTASVSEVGLLVPLVVTQLEHPEGDVRFELVDGERRYWAARQLRMAVVPAHILPAGSWERDLRTLMFHLHMTREQWGPLAQCRSLAEAYPELDRGLKFEEKEIWSRKLARETGMSAATARDRIHVLAWEKAVKDKVFAFGERQPKRDIYSYVLAIEVSVVEPSRDVFADYYNHGRPPEIQANVVRDSLFSKVTCGLETGHFVGREQIRGISPLFTRKLPENEHRTALRLFKRFIDEPEFQFDDVKSEINAYLPTVSVEKTTKPQRLVSSIKSLVRALEAYEPEFIDNSFSREPSRRKHTNELIDALDQLSDTIAQLKERLNGLEG